MTRPIRYTIFETKWGYFGLAASDKGLLRTCLPCKSQRNVEHHLIKGLDNPQFEKNLLRPLQNKIVAYFEGRQVKLQTPLVLNNLSTFERKVLAGCRKIPYGKTIIYSQLASQIGRRYACRAVGNALAKNPLPLVIPCHRVIRSDNSIGSFSAPGGTILKAKLVSLERGIAGDRQNQDNPVIVAAGTRLCREWTSRRLRLGLDIPRR
jgi:methylated-DNA-[protein]-cysteine S-methyltransferase